MKYKSHRIVGWMIVDENGKIVNRNPSKEELKGLEEEKYKRKKYTYEELSSYLRQFYEEYGRIPSARDFKNNPEYPDYHTYQKRFGSWNKALEKTFGLKRDKHKTYTEEELLNGLRLFEKEYGRIPTEKDFRNNPEYPSIWSYHERFGSWIDSLIKAGLNVDLMGRQGDKYRGRQVEIAILNHLENKPIDLSGENRNSYCDAIDPNDGPYEVKSSRLCNGTYYLFTTRNEDKDDDKESIQWYYFVAMNGDNKIKHVWRVPGEMVEKDYFIVGLNSNYKFNVKNMEEYDITGTFKDIFKELF